ncbi:MAG TPA: tripartite tricarboxylate transporter substrate binding protein [Burkholderiales bacterium]|nr:tripartite tricarboxylate transporter substrate binding protein [Burkholderiales bacterium]
MAAGYGRVYWHVLAAGFASIAAQAVAQPASDWPNKPVRFIVPFPPGGSVDPLARLTGARLNATLGQQFVVDNRPGGSGAIGTAMGAKSAPDGYTYIVVFDTHAVNPSLISNLPYDTLKDLSNVMLVGTAPMALTTNPAKPYRNLDDVIKLAKAKPATLTFGSVGNGSLGHLAMMLTQQQGGMKMIHIPYKGGGPATTDAIGGQIDFAITSVAVPLPHIKAGRLRAVVTTGETRASTMPDVQTMIEGGLTGLAAYAWWGIVAPVGIPAVVADKVHAELVKVYNQPEIRKQLTEQFGMDMKVSTSAEMTKFLTSEITRWARVVKENNIHAD